MWKKASSFACMSCQLWLCGSRYSIAAAWSAAKARSLRPWPGTYMDAYVNRTVRHAVPWGAVAAILQASTLVDKCAIGGAGDWPGCSDGCGRLMGRHESLMQTDR